MLSSQRQITYPWSQDQTRFQILFLQETHLDFLPHPTSALIPPPPFLVGRPRFLSLCVFFSQGPCLSSDRELFESSVPNSPAQSAWLGLSVSYVLARLQWPQPLHLPLSVQPPSVRQS